MRGFHHNSILELFSFGLELSLSLLQMEVIWKHYFPDSLIKSLHCVNLLYKFIDLENMLWIFCLISPLTMNWTTMSSYVEWFQRAIVSAPFLKWECIFCINRYNKSIGFNTWWLELIFLVSSLIFCSANLRLKMNFVYIH